MSTSLKSSVPVIDSESVRIDNVDSDLSPTTTMKFTDLRDKPTSYLINVEERIKDLTEWLGSGEMPRQEKNIKAVLNEYKSGAVPDFNHPWWFIDGEKRYEGPMLDSSTFSTLNPQSRIWFEPASQPMDLRFSVGNLGCSTINSQNTPLATTGHHPAMGNQLALSATYGIGPNSMHAMPAFIRLPPQLGGNPNIVAGVTIFNDTGSDFQTVYPEELLALDYNRFTYGSHGGHVRLRTGSG